MKKSRPTEFTDLIAYAGSSLDPMKVFMARRVTSVANAIFQRIWERLANVREVPSRQRNWSASFWKSDNRGFGGLIKDR